MSTENWYCLKARPRQERTAKSTLIHDLDIEVFCPLLRFERARRSGRVKVSEAMFPGYLFARFDYEQLYRQVRTTRGISTIVSFGAGPVIVPNTIISELREAVSEGETIEIPTAIHIGEEVRILDGPFQGIQAVVTNVLPARERVTVLLELLGMEREVEIAEKAVIPNIPHPLASR